jgi:hypothetical protein
MEEDRGRGYHPAATLIRTWVVVLDRCVVTVALAGVLAAVLSLVIGALYPPE